MGFDLGGFIEKPSDLKYDDARLQPSELNIHQHRLPVDHTTAGFDSWGQGRLLREATVSMSAAAREKRDSMAARIKEASVIVGKRKNFKKRWLIWHDLEDERKGLEEMFPEFSSVYGVCTAQKIDAREDILTAFSDGDIPGLMTKPSIAGSGNNFQRHCYSAIFLGLGFKFHDFIQAVHRIYRFGQEHEVDLHLTLATSNQKTEGL